MKNTILTALVLLAGLLATGSMARAQETLAVQVRHDFVVNGRTLPAGAYHISRGSNVSLGMLLIRSNDGKSALFFLPSTVQSSVSGMPHLSFIRNGDQYVLSGVQTSNETYTVFATEQKANSDVQPASTMSSGN